LYAYRYFALELFSCTLYHYCKGQYHGPVLDKSQASFQILSAVNYIHSKGFVHGDLNPINIVIMSQHLPVRIKISDFGLSKFSYTKCESSDEKLSIDFPEICKRKYWSMSSLKVKDNYKNECNTGDEDRSNPELISSPLNEIYPKDKDDVFAVGCIIFYFLALFHPFGDEDDPGSILVNMKQKKMVNLKSKFCILF
jgi:serine/threonine protein kinase